MLFQFTHNHSVTFWLRIAGWSTTGECAAQNESHYRVRGERKSPSSYHPYPQ